MQLSEKEMVRMEIQGLLDQFYTKQNQNGSNKRYRQYFLEATTSQIMSDLVG